MWRNNVLFWLKPKCTRVLLAILFLIFGIQNCKIAIATINPNSYTINVSIQNQNQGITVLDTSSAERYESVMRTFNVSTNAPSGYRIYADIDSNEESEGNLTLIGGDSSSPSINMLNTTPATASTLNTNTWGFGIPSTTTGLPTNNYSSSYSTSNPSPNSTYSGIQIDPVYTLIRNVQGPVNGTDSFNLYYGMRIGSDILSNPGTYETNITYHALIEATNIVGGEATILPTSGPKSGYETVTITTSLMTDFVPDNISVTIDNQSCNNPRGTISTGTLMITCVTQAHTPGLTDVAINIGSLGINYLIEDGYEYLETGDVKIANVSYVSGVNVNGTPHPTVDNDNNVDFDLTFKSGVTQDNNTFQATYRFTMSNTTSSDYIFTAPVSNLVLRLSSTTTSEVYYELSGISVGDTIPANSTVNFNVILSADYASGTHGVEGGMEVEPIEDKSGALIGTISGSNEGDLTGNHDLAMFQLSVQNTFASSKVFTINILGNDFVTTNSSGSYLDAQTIASNTTATYAFYVKKATGATYGSDYINTTIVINYDGIQVSVGTLKLAVDKDPSYIDNEAPYINGVTITRTNTIGSAIVSWSGTDNVGVASYSIYPCAKNGNSYTCGNPIANISGNATSYTLTGLSDGTYGVVVVGFDDEGNTATQQEIDTATTDPGYASRSPDTEIRWNFDIVGQITNGSLSNNGQTIQMGATYTGTISPNSSYSTPSSITVKMNNRTLTSNEYSYSNGSVRITIPVDGDIEITANCPWDWCLIEGTMIALADGTSIPIEQVNYDSLLKVWNYETGSIGAEYPAWIEKEASTHSYQLTKFDDGTELKTAGWHGVFDVDRNAFISVDDSQGFGVGSRVYKVNENDQLEIITVTSIDRVEETVNYYHVVSSQYYNIIANNVITTDGAVYLSNLYGFEENLKWPELREQIISNPNNLYTYEDFVDIGLPRKMFDDLRMGEAKYLANVYGITLEAFKDYLLSNQLNTDIWLPYCEASIRLQAEYCVSESDDEELPPIVNPQQNIVQSNKNYNTSNSEDNQNLTEPENDNIATEPLGVSETTSGTTVSTNNAILGGIALGAATTAVAIGVSYLASKRKKDEEQ